MIQIAVLACQQLSMQYMVALHESYKAIVTNDLDLTVIHLGSDYTGLKGDKRLMCSPAIWSNWFVTNLPHSQQFWKVVLIYKVKAFTTRI
eukprot:Awhi_evm2s1379